MKTLLAIVLTLTLVIVTSAISVTVWGEKSEEIAHSPTLNITADMTIAEFGASNSLSKPLLNKIFTIDNPLQLQQTIGSLGSSMEQITEEINKNYVIATEHSSKNWFKIPLKFVLWFAYLTLCFILLRRGKITKRTRLILYAIAFTIFGIILGADPSPMGTVKDAIVLYATNGVVFKPRLVAFTIFTITVVLANKFICSWGCQLGTLQDFLFRLNRNHTDSAAGYLPQFKIPFVISNIIRIAFLCILTWVAFAWSYDISHEIDPFKLFKPLSLSIGGGIFVLAIALASVFTYRPWCHLFCPFGLTGWLFEKISVFRIRVNRDKCISCLACEKACPSTVMSAILKEDKLVIPDCFSCGSCLESCQSDAISFSRRTVGKHTAD